MCTKLKLHKQSKSFMPADQCDVKHQGMLFFFFLQPFEWTGLQGNLNLAHGHSYSEPMFHALHQEYCTVVEMIQFTGAALCFMLFVEKVHYSADVYQ